MCVLLLVYTQWDQKGEKKICIFGVIDDVAGEFYPGACE